VIGPFLHMSDVIRSSYHIQPSLHIRGRFSEIHNRYSSSLVFLFISGAGLWVLRPLLAY
jgi:hypothetical protein